MAVCEHWKQARDIEPAVHVCEECVKLGDTWVHLRECLICGHVGCCDSSKNKHATRHYRQTKHPVMRSAQAGEEWGWCYVDRIMVDLSEGIALASVTE